MATASPARPLRADAVRNRAKILQAAAEQITAHGPDVGMGEIAKSADVAVGTLYRHFPTKTDLVAAVMAGYVRDIAADAADALTRAQAGADPLDEVLDFLDRVTESTAKNHSVKAAAAGLGVVDHGDAEAEVSAATALGDLLALAQAAGRVHPSITVQDIYLLVSTAPADQPEPVRRRWMDLMAPGLAEPRRRDAVAEGL